MNHIFKTVFNKSTGTFVAVPEIAKGRVKTSGHARKVSNEGASSEGQGGASKIAKLSLLSAIIMVLSGQSAFALPTGGVFTGGAGTIVNSGSTTNITATGAGTGVDAVVGGRSQAAVINWGSPGSGGFNIQNGETVNFIKNNQNISAWINIDKSGSLSVLNGALNSYNTTAGDGTGAPVLLVNPNGMSIGGSAVLSPQFIGIAGNYNATDGSVTMNNAPITVDPAYVIQSGLVWNTLPNLSINTAASVSGTSDNTLPFIQGSKGVNGVNLNPDASTTQLNLNATSKSTSIMNLQQGGISGYGGSVLNVAINLPETTANNSASGGISFRNGALDNVNITTNGSTTTGSESSADYLNLLNFGSGNGVDAPADITMNGNINLTSDGAYNNYSLYVGNGTGGSVIAKNANITASHGFNLSSMGSSQQPGSVSVINSTLDASASVLGDNQSSIYSGSGVDINNSSIDAGQPSLYLGVNASGKGTGEVNISGSTISSMSGSDSSLTYISNLGANDAGSSISGSGAITINGIDGVNGLNLQIDSLNSGIVLANTQGDLSINRDIVSAGNVELDASGLLDISGNITSDANVLAQAGAVTQEAGSVISAPNGSVTIASTNNYLANILNTNSCDGPCAPGVRIFTAGNGISTINGNILVGETNTNSAGNRNGNSIEISGIGGVTQGSTSLIHNYNQNGYGGGIYIHADPFFNSGSPPPPANVHINGLIWNENNPNNGLAGIEIDSSNGAVDIGAGAHVKSIPGYTQLQSVGNSEPVVDWNAGNRETARDGLLVDLAYTQTGSVNTDQPINGYTPSGYAPASIAINSDSVDSKGWLDAGGTLYLKAKDGSSVYGDTPGIGVSLVDAGGNVITPDAITDLTVDASGVTYNNAPTNTSNVGQYLYSYYGGAITNGADSSRYNIQGYSKDGNWQITPAALTLSGVNVSDKVYDGNTSAVVSGGTLSGIVNGDSVGSVTSGEFANKNVGQGIDVYTVSQLAGSGAGNYVLTNSASTLKGNITPKPIGEIAVADNKVYDGNTTAIVSSITSKDLIAGDSVSFGYAHANFDSANVGTNKPVIVDGITASGADAGNYVVTSTATTTADITPKSLTVNGLDAANKVYDGNTNAVITGGTVTGLVAGDVLSTSSTGSFSTKNAGNNIDVNAHTVLVGEGGGNYVLTNQTNTLKGDITPKPIGEIAVADNKPYDGNTTAVVSSITSNDLIAGDNVVFNYTNANFNTPNVGSGKPVTVDGITASGADAGNYIVTPTVTTSADITGSSAQPIIPIEPPVVPPVVPAQPIIPIEPPVVPPVAPLVAPPVASPTANATPINVVVTLKPTDDKPNGQAISMVGNSVYVAVGDKDTPLSLTVKTGARDSSDASGDKTDEKKR